MKHARASIVAALFVLAPAAGLPAWAETDKVDEYVQAEMAKEKIPGLSIAVVRNGEIVKAKGYGLANVGLNVAATPDTIYQSGSIGKQFTATLAMMLIEEGKLGLDDPVSKYLPSAPPAWQGFTTSIARYVDDRLTVIVMTSFAGARPERIGKVIAGIYNADLAPVEHHAVKIDPKVFDAYIGEYELRPKITLGISREGDRFWAKATGQGRVELLAESETTFFFDDSETDLTFVKDANGTVTHLVLHQNGDLEARKIR